MPARLLDLHISLLSSGSGTVWEQYLQQPAAPAAAETETHPT